MAISMVIWALHSPRRNKQLGMLKQFWTYLCGWLLFWSSFPLTAAAPNARYCVDVWGVEEGLPQSSVISMIQTRDGYLWLGTLNGLVRFDGMQFKVFDESNTQGLQSGRIVHLFEDSQTNLWIGTETAGASVVKNGHVIDLKMGQGNRDSRLVGAGEDASGAVWLYTADGQIRRYFHDTVNVWNGDFRLRSRSLVADTSGVIWEGTELGLYSLKASSMSNSVSLFKTPVPNIGRVDALLASRKGGLWILADGRIKRWDTNQIERYYGSYPWTKPYAEGLTVCEDREGNLVVGTPGEGLFWFDGEGRYTRISAEERNYILSLHVDAEGSLWAGTDGGGLVRVKRQVFSVLEPSLDLTSWSVCGDDKGGLWFSSWVTLQNLGLSVPGITYYRDGVTNPFDIPSQNAIRAILVDRKQRVWATTLNLPGHAGLFCLQNGVFQPAPGSERLNRDISAIFEDRAGQIWVGTRAGLACWDEQSWKVYTTADGLSANVVRAISEDSEGALWIGTEGGGLNKLQNGKITSFQEPEGVSKDISSLYVDSKGVLWVGTLGKGLLRFKNGQWTHYTTENGLSGNSVDYLIEDEHGFLWIGSNNGLMRVEIKALNDFAERKISVIPCRTYGKRDGLPSSECTMGAFPAACRTRDGKLWFPTIKGIASVDPARIEINTNLPPVVIESVWFEGKKLDTNGPRMPLPGTILIPPSTERLDIQYTSLNLASPDRARFKYQMEGHEKAWSEDVSRRAITYSKLPPGHYRFRVKACNEDGVWNETGASIGIVVQPEFWQTRAFTFVSGVCVLAMVVGMVRYVSTQKLNRQLAGLRQEHALEAERARIARDIHDQVGASLTQVSLLGEMVESDKDLPEEVEIHARQISQTARETSRALDEIVWTVNPSNDTLEGLINYICKHVQEYLAVAGLRYRLEVPEALPDVQITPEARHNVFLAAKEAVTNVVKHAKATEVVVRLTLTSSKFLLEIEDNGRGPEGFDDKAKQSRNGLRNMRKRMEDVGGEFSIGPGSKGGSRVCLTSPIGKS